MDTANCLAWQRGHGKWSGPGHLDKVVGFTNLSNIILLHSFLFVLWLWRNAMFVSRGLSCHCVLFSVCVYPPCVQMVLVLSGMCFAVTNGAGLVRYVFCCNHFYCWCFTSTPFRGLACIFNRACTAACCLLPHLEAEQVIFLETVAFCPLPIERLSSSPEYWIWNKPLYLNPHSVSEPFGPNPHFLTATEARSITQTRAQFVVRAEA